MGKRRLCVYIINVHIYLKEEKEPVVPSAMARGTGQVTAA